MDEILKNKIMLDIFESVSDGVYQNYQRRFRLL